jgi:hypothetical protein
MAAMGLEIAAAHMPGKPQWWICEGRSLCGGSVLIAIYLGIP